jgi:antitoxin HicB
MHSYPVTLTQDDGAYCVSFPDIPEAITQGDTLEDALKQAQDALESALDFYFEDKRPVPAPSKPKRGQHCVTLSASLSVKVLMLNEMINKKMRPADLARLLNTTPQEVNRLTNLRHTSRIDSMANALRAMGRQLQFSVA